MDGVVRAGKLAARVRPRQSRVPAACPRDRAAGGKSDERGRPKDAAGAARDAFPVTGSHG